MNARTLSAVAIAALVATPLLIGRESVAPTQRMTSTALDSAQVGTFLAGVRGASPMQCELSVHTVDQQFGWQRPGIMPDAADAPHELMHRALQRIDDPTTVPQLAGALRGPDPCARRIAARLLGRSRLPAAVDALTDALGASDENVRIVAAVGLGRAERRETVGRLVGALADPAPTVRAAVAWALGQIESREAETALVRLLETDPAAQVRRAAALAIGDLY
ncbi:MAG TPA: HEAT repeat domain-containing protein [Gemmatimonadales bacterium]